MPKENENEGIYLKIQIDFLLACKALVSKKNYDEFFDWWKEKQAKNFREIFEKINELERVES